jgi:hypothetical protein
MADVKIDPRPLPAAVIRQLEEIVNKAMGAPKNLDTEYIVKLFEPARWEIAEAAYRLAETQTRFVWLVERIQAMQLNGQATYWTGMADKNLPEVETNNPWDACWFGRKQDAMRIALLTFGKPLARNGWQIVEHGFAAAIRAASPTEGA